MPKTLIQSDIVSPFRGQGFEQGLKIDIHTHIMPEHVPNWFQKFGYGEFIRLEHHKPCCARMIKGDKVFREIEHNAWDPTVRTKEMDMTEVSTQVISTIPVL